MDGRWAAGPAQIADMEVQTWNKLWQGTETTQEGPRRMPVPNQPLLADGPTPEVVLTILRKAGKLSVP
eukprot:3230650-Amphidinium_carterae.2